MFFQGDSHKASDLVNIRDFILAGNSTFTLRSKKTATRYTFKVTKRAGDSHFFFVGILSAPNNEDGYACVGTISDFTKFKPSKLGIEKYSGALRAFIWFWQMTILGNSAILLNKIEFFHEGRCCKCGRKLTVPESIVAGIGPECSRLSS